MQPFATTSDIADGWRALTTDEQTRAESLLVRASAMIASELDRAGVTWPTTTEPLATNLVTATCNVVRRAMSVPTDFQPVSQYTQSAVGYSETMAYANPNGDMYLTAQEKSSLGIGRQRMGFMRPHIRPGGEEVANW